MAAGCCGFAKTGVILRPTSGSALGRLPDQSVSFDDWGLATGGGMTAGLDPKLYQLMAEQVQDYAIFLLDVDGKIASWNAGAKAIKQYSADDVIGQDRRIQLRIVDVE